MDDARKTYLIIGANGVFGRLISEALVQRGATVIGTARSNESASSLPATLAQKLLLDLESQDSIQQLVQYLTSSNTSIDGIINASGRVGFGTVAETTNADAKRLMQVNHFGPAQVFAGLMPVLAESTNDPFVLSITGVVAEKVFPGMAAYTTSKTAHSTWLKALALEARRQKVRVMDARPGHTETGLASRALFGSAPAFEQGMTPEHVVNKIIEAIEAGITELPSDSFSA
jgi:cyclic-di-GMP-binding biofilm dispersal mediator protein